MYKHFYCTTFLKRLEGKHYYLALYLAQCCTLHGSGGGVLYRFIVTPQKRIAVRVQNLGINFMFLTPQVSHSHFLKLDLYFFALYT